MGERVLKNSPLTEAYFEMRWVLIGAGQAELIQSSYDVMLEHLINVIKDAYPYHNELPLASLPAGLTMYFIQHQFRRQEQVADDSDRARYCYSEYCRGILLVRF